METFEDWVGKANNPKELGFIPSNSGTLYDLPEAMLDAIYEFLDGIDLEQADEDYKNTKYYLHTSEDCPGLGAVVEPHYIAVLCRMTAFDAEGKRIDDRMFKIGIPRDEDGEVIRIIKQTETPQ